MVVRGHERADPEVVAALAAGGVATVHEAQGRSELLLPRLRPIYDGAAAAGSAVTVLCHPGDNLMIHLAVELCRPGDVLVVAMTSENEDGLLGELLATSLRAHGVVAAILDCGVRDVAALRGPEIKISFRAWLFTIVDRRGIADYFRKHEDDPAVGLLPNEHDGDEDVWGEMMASAEETGYVGTMQIVERTLGELSTVHQAVVELHIFQAFSAKETAELVNERPDAEAEGTAMTENNVNAIASRFRKRLRVNLDLDESDTEPER